MNHFRASFLDELEKTAERKRSSKKKRAAGTGTGAVAGAAMGAPAGILGALAMMAMSPKRFRIATPKGLRATHKFLTKGGLERELNRVGKEGRKQVVKGLAGGAAGGGAIGGLAGHEISKQAAVIASRITPGSTSVRGYSYDKKSGNLLVTFKNGGTYRYKGVSPAAARAMGRNKSVGKTVHKRIKMGGYQYEKVGAKKKQKSYKCKFCKDPATKGVIWAEGRAIVPCCDKHLEKGKAAISEKPDLIRDLTKTARFITMSELRAYGERNPERTAKIRAKLDEQGWYSTDGKPLRKQATGDLVKSPENRAAFAAKRALSAKDRFIRSRQGDPNSSTAKYYAKKRRDARMAKKAEEEPIMLQVEPHEPLPEETPISARVFQNLTAQAKTLPEEATASQSELVMDKMAQQRRSIAKMADAAKKQVTWQGLTMKLEHEKGDLRSGVNGATGKKWSRKMRDGYGYVPGTYGKGADGEAIDIYFNDTPVDDVDTDVYKIRQKKKTGEYDEDKFMVGYASAADAKKAFLRNMPSWAFSDMTSLGMSSFKTLVGQDQKKRKAS